jgi:hypothetical protein
MRKLGVFTALALSGMTAACAERLASPAMIPKPASIQRPEFKSRNNNVELRPQAKKATENTRKHLAVRDKGILPSTSNVPNQRSGHRAPLPQTSPEPQETSIERDPPVVAARPPHPEPAELNFPVAALMPSPAEPAEPTFPSAPPPIELPSPPEPLTSTLPEMPIEAAMPPPPEPAEPSFPVAALMPPPPEPAEPSLPSQDEIAKESSIPYPELPAPLSLQPRFDWEEVTGSLEMPRNPVAEAFEVSPEPAIPSLVRDPWPLPIGAS